MLIKKLPEQAKQDMVERDSSFSTTLVKIMRKGVDVFYAGIKKRHLSKSKRLKL
ncbi:hypothetical protein [Acinetobacter haemolyticus]|uniref:hypothetical protein n=1 Tax=Acinetobacter haemolyticus TaxID=29430 RepID=UPI00148EB37B|nr:hypothetical protein [Acinetobacter haemolyticus]